jgi:molybdenum cofactor synthesis domain-containing protein
VSDAAPHRPNPIASLLVIGNEVLSGRTRDANIQFLAARLGDIGIPLREVRIIPDVAGTIVATVNEVRARFDHVFTTGGIGPTHDDITADAVAKAFGLPIDYDPRAVEILRARLSVTGGEMNEARMRMTRVPKGAELVLNKISAAPGFMIGNVIVMAGIPRVMQAMLEYVTPQLKTGTAMLSQSVRGDCREGDIGTELGTIAGAHAGVVIGSYPFMDEDRRPNTDIVLRSRDPQKLAEAKAAVEAMLKRLHAAAG